MAPAFAHLTNRIVRTYLGTWRAALGQVWGFQGRAFYPPPDPVNATLSFGYTLLLHDVLAAGQIAGLDPYLGTFHAPEAGRPSLALDLMEEFRPLVADRLTLTLLQSGELQPEQFAPSQERPGTFALDAAGRALFIARYEQAMQTPTPLPSGEQTPLRRIILLQAQAFVRAVRGEQPAYVGYTP